MVFNMYYTSTQKNNNITVISQSSEQGWSSENRTGHTVSFLKVCLLGWVFFLLFIYLLPQNEDV